jgi:uridine monophosphate synthetase
LKIGESFNVTLHVNKMTWKDEKEELGKEITCLLYEKGLIKTWYRDRAGGWTLFSGLWSPFYIQLRPLSSYPELLKKVGYALGKMIEEECNDVNKVVGVAMAGIPLASAVAILEGIPSLWTRKIDVRSSDEFEKYIQSYGEHTLVEGEFEEGDRIAVIDDLATKFDSKLVAIEQINHEAKKRGLKVKCKDVVVLLDREQGAAAVASQHGISFHSLIPFKSKGLEWLKNSLSEIEYEILTKYLRDEEKYQDAEVQKELYEMCV